VITSFSPRDNLKPPSRQDEVVTVAYLRAVERPRIDP